ncbi:olfactory receptor 8G17-like [Mixophyes fleayi]|uniref:olfactory receptor 8G17-like n=1 Tax=Mixophyes fleayi TaxID=3061075 RepID=UPI003F4E1948
MFLNAINQTMMTYFIIKGITDVPELQAPVFLLVLLIYLLTLGGNMTILLLICLDQHLHTPMYFFLSNLSIVDLSSINITLHKVLLIFIAGDNTISYIACITQLYIFASLTGHELLILTAMSYDRYVAICKPLRYNMIMNHKVCTILVTSCYLMGFLQVIPAVLFFSGFSCYTTNEINHYFCDMIALMKISCNEKSVLEITFLIQCLSILALIPFLLTIISYIFIIFAILRIHSDSGKRKAFYTCSSHLSVVILLYVTLVSQYLTPTSNDALNTKKLFSLLNTAAVPLLNPLIYSLKNKDVMSAVKQRLNLCKTVT